jgi:hypothetical protein
MRIDPSTASAEEIERMNRDWMEMQKRPPPPSSPPTPRPQTPVVADDSFSALPGRVPAGFGNEGFGPNRFKDDLRAVMSNDIFPISPGQLPTGGQFPASPYGRNPYGPSLGMGRPSYGGGFGQPQYGGGFGRPSYGGGFGRPSYGGIGNLFSQLAYMPEDVYNTGMQRFQQSMPMFGEYGGFGQYGPQRGGGFQPRPQQPVIADDTNFGGLPTGGNLPPITGGPRPTGPMGGFDPYRNYMTDASGLPPGVYTMMPSTPTTGSQNPNVPFSQPANPYSTGYGMGYQQQSGMGGGMGMGYGAFGGGGYYRPSAPPSNSASIGGKGGANPDGAAGKGGSGGYDGSGINPGGMYG